VATVDCPACSQPTSIDVKTGATIIPSKGKHIVCEGSAVNLTVDAAWPAVLLADKKVEVYYKKLNGTETVLKTITDGGTTTSSNGNVFTIAALTASDTGRYVFGVRNTTSCKLEDTIRISFLRKILNNAIIANDTICLGGTAKQIVQDPNKTLSGDLAAPPASYKWESSYNGGAYGTVASATTGSYAPIGISAAGTYNYRRIALAKDGICADSTSKPVTLLVQSPINHANNTATPATQTICSGNAPTITGSAVTDATYQWLQASVTTGPWTKVNGGNTQDMPSVSLSNTNSGTSVSYFFKRAVKVGECEDTSAVVEVKVSGGMTAGEIEKDQYICKDGLSLPAKITSKSIATGGTTPPILYEWQTSPNGKDPWTSVGASSSTALDYTPTAIPSSDTLYYRRKAIAGTGLCDNAATSPIKVILIVPPVAEISSMSPSIISTTPPAVGKTTTRNPSILIEAKDPGANYEGAWTITNGRGTGLKGGDMKAFKDSLLLKNFNDQTDAVWAVKDKYNACPSVSAKLEVLRKNFTLPDAGPDARICITQVPSYKLIGNDFTAGDETATWKLVSSIPTGAVITQTGTTKEATFTVPNQGVYEFAYQIVNSVLGEDHTDTVKITVDSAVVKPVLTKDILNICTDEVNLTAVPAKPSPTAIGTWKFDPLTSHTTQVITAPNNPTSLLSTIPSPSVTKLYWVVENGVCPKDSALLTVNQVGQITPATISLNGTKISGTDTVICIGTTNTLTSSAHSTDPTKGESSSWTPAPSGTSITIAGGTSTNQPVTINSEGATKVTWTISSTTGCPDAVKEVTVYVFDKPVLQPLVGSPICEEQNGTYYAKSVIPATNDTLPISAYNWYTTASTPPGSKGIATVQGANNTATGIFKFSSTATTGATDKATVSVTATNACGTSASQDLEVTINLRPRDFAGPIDGDLEICQSSQVNRLYTIPAQATNVTIVNWYLDKVALPSGAQPLLVTEIPYQTWETSTVPKSLKAQLVNDCGVGVADSIEIKIIPAIPVVAKLSGYDTVCLPRDAFTYTASSPNAGTNPTYLFTITNTDGSVGKTQGPGASNTFSTVVGDLKNGSKIAVEIVGDPLTGCFTSGSGVDERIIDGYEYPDTTVALHSNDTVCFGNKVIFSIDNTKKGNTIYTWYKDNNPVKSSTQSFIELANRPESGHYKVKIENEVCDAQTSGEHRARIFDTPVVRFNPDEVLMEISVMPDFTLAPEITGLTGDTLTQVSWTPTDLLKIPSPLSTTALFTPPSTGGQFVYSISIATGEGNVFCPATANIKIFALPPVKVPNAFSPNNDGLNELWQIDGIESYPRARVIVYNRWGNKMHDVSPYNGQNGWDGTTNGIKLPMGTYYYVIDLNENTVVQSRYLTGSLTIVH